MLFFDALKKIIKRKKVDGFYEASYLLTPKEKQSLIVGFSIITVPVLIGLILVITN